MKSCQTIGGSSKAKTLIAAAYDFFERYNRRPRDVRLIIGSDLVEFT